MKSTYLGSNVFKIPVLEHFSGLRSFVTLLYILSARLSLPGLREAFVYEKGI
jgi:hypothetical protein